MFDTTKDEKPEKVKQVLAQAKEKKAEAVEEVKEFAVDPKENIHSNIWDNIFMKDLEEYVTMKSWMILHSYNNKTFNQESHMVLWLVLKHFWFVKEKNIRIMDLKTKDGKPFWRMDLWIRL